ncbi:hypothetical protein RHOSPDRAFT_12760, partial [Rhodotorula sp. JG-1b]
PLTQKVKYLFRKYGWTTLVVYLGLSAVDFGLCFLVIYWVGADRVRSAEDWVLDKLHWKRRSDDKDKAEGGGGNRYGTIATTAVLAYAIHKTLFLPVRVGITVAITPKVVRMLQGW